MRWSQLSIRSILLSIIGALTLLITALVLQETYTQWRRLSEIESLKHATVLSDHLFDAAEKISVERDIAYSILYASDEGTIHSLHPRLESSRKETDEALQTTFEAVERYNFSELVDLLHKTKTQFLDLQKLRQQIDSAIVLPLEKRDRTLSQRWFTDATAMILQTQNVWMQFIKHFTDIDSFVTLHLRFKHFLGIIMDYSGRERAFIGRLLVENADPSPQEQAQLLQWQGVIDLGWTISDTLASQGKLYPAISSYFKDARSHYYTVYDMTHELFYVPRAKHGASYPIGVDFWLELATEATDSLNTLRDSALKQTHNYMNALEVRTRHEIVINALFLLCALGLCLYSFWIITRRVIFPIDAMVGALMDATKGKPVSLAPLFQNRQDEIGKLAQVLHAFQQNVEKIKLAERNNALLAAIVESSEDAILSKTLDGVITSWNIGAEHLFGYSAAEIVGKHISLLIPPARIQEEGNIVAQLREGKQLEHFETARRHRNGHDIDVALTVSPIRNEAGEIIGASKIIHDITARKEAERKMLESQERYRALVEASSQIIWVWKEGAIEGMSPLARWWETTTGQPAADIATFGWLEVAHPDDRDRVRKLWENAMTQHTNLEMEYRLRARNGSYVHVEVRAVPLLDPDGSLREFIGSLNDVTARKEAEIELLSYTKALERSNKELDDFAYIASHDLKEPLRGLHNHARFLLEDNQDKLDADSVSRLGRLTYLSQRMEKLVNDLLYFSRLGRQELAIQSTDITEVIHDIESTLDVFLVERQTRILIPKPLPTVICDKPRITEVFRNLITNAVKYNDSQEKQVEIGFLSTHMLSGTVFNDVFYVKDNGRGIASGFYEEIFRIFKRLQNNKDSQEEGTGVGLTFVKKIVERHGGKIWLESEVGKGTIFYFTLKGEAYGTKTAA